MRISLQFKDLQVTASERQRIEDRIRLALTRFAPLVRGLSATVSDENGSRGGVDKKCRLVVRLHAGTVVVNEQAGAVIAAVAQAAERAARAVARVHHRAVDARQTVPGARRRRGVTHPASDRHGSPESDRRGSPESDRRGSPDPAEATMA
jgi:ribosome-associated translation inhibitor RaiA